MSARDAVIQRLDCGRNCIQAHLHGCWHDQLLQGFWMEVFSSSPVVGQKPPYFLARWLSVSEQAKKESQREKTKTAEAAVFCN